MDTPGAPLLKTPRQASAKATHIEHVQMALGDAPALDLAAWSRGLVQTFEQERGPVLPEDERALLRQWCDESIRLVEVVSTRPGTSLLARAGDQEIEVRDRLGSRSVSPGDLLATRLLPGGGGATIASFVAAVPRQLAASLRIHLQSDDGDLGFAEWYAAAHRPPEMRNRRGHDLVLCTGRWQVPAGALARLESELGPADGGAVTLLDGDSIVAQLAVDGTELTVSTMSREDYETATALVRRLVPGAQEESLDALPAASVLSGEVTPLRRADQGPDLADDPAVRAVLQERIEAYERDWLDLDIPALGGLTPRAALEDPTARGLLVAMLDDWPETEQGMSPGRVRALLGLT